MIKMKIKTTNNSEFQTPNHVCRYMISLIPEGVKTVLEPTPGNGNIVKELKKYNYDIIAPDDFFTWKQHRVDCIIMNPPFRLQDWNCNNMPKNIIKLNGIRVSFWLLFELMDLSDNIIALMSWYVLINSYKRILSLMDFGLKSVINLPRSIFKNSRVQTCIIQLNKSHKGQTVFKQYRG